MSVYKGASKYPGHYWKSGVGYVKCPKKGGSKAVKAACRESRLSGYSKTHRRSRRVRRRSKRY